MSLYYKACAFFGPEAENSVQKAKFFLGAGRYRTCMPPRRRPEKGTGAV